MSRLYKEHYYKSFESAHRAQVCRLFGTLDWGRYCILGSARANSRIMVQLNESMKLMKRQFVRYVMSRRAQRRVHRVQIGNAISFWLKGRRAIVDRRVIRSCTYIAQYCVRLFVKAFVRIGSLSFIRITMSILKFLNRMIANDGTITDLTSLFAKKTHFILVRVTCKIQTRFIFNIVRLIFRLRHFTQSTSSSFS